MKNIFLESHNIKNTNAGLGQFNYHLIKGLYNQKPSDLKFTLNVKDKTSLYNEYGGYFDYHKYKSHSRYPLFRVRKRSNLWHSMNQNTKIEPASKIPYLTTIHDVNFMSETKADSLSKRLKLFKGKLERSSALVYISEFAKKSTHQYFDVPNVPEYVVYNGNPMEAQIKFDISNFKPHFIKDNTPFLFSIGQILQKKNFHTIVEMMNFLPDFKLYIAGKNKTAYAEKVRQIIQKHKLQRKVFLTGMVTEKEKQFLYQNCSAFLFPSIREGFGIPPIEAMSFGKPVFLSNHTSLPEIGGRDAYYWEQFNSEYMANVLIQGLDDFNKNKKQKTQALQARAKSFNWDFAAQEYIGIYNSILNH